MLQPAFGRDQADKEAGEVAVDFGLVRQAFGGLFEQVEAQPGDVQGFGQHALDLVAALVVQRFAHAAGDGPRRVDALPAQDADDFLAEAAQTDAVAGDIGIFGDQPGDVAQGRVAFHAQAAGPGRRGDRS